MAFKNIKFKRLLTETKGLAEPVTAVELSLSEVQLLRNALKVFFKTAPGSSLAGGLSIKLNSAQTKLKEYQLTGARSDADVEAFRDYMGGGYGLGVPKRMLAIYYAQQKKRHPNNPDFK